jgi:hypothetical protein
VIVEDAIAFLDRMQMLLSERVLDTAPDRSLVLHEIVEAVMRRFFFEQPVHTVIVISD